MRFKKGYVRTLEAAIAMGLSFVFIMMFIPSANITPLTEDKISLISIAEQDPIFRDCVVSDNYSCINFTFCSYYPAFCNGKGFRFNISNDPNAFISDLPEGNIYLETLYIAGNTTSTFPKIVKLYYWNE